MFKNSGKKIMGFVNFVFYFNLVLAIVALIGGSVYIYTQEGLDLALIVFLCGIVAVFVYMLVVFLSLLCLYAFGEMVQSTVETRRILAQMQLEPQRFAAQPVRSTPKREPVPAAPVAPPAPQDFRQELDLDLEFTPRQPQDPTSNLAYDYKAAAGAPVFPVPSSGIQATEILPEQPQTPDVVVCPKCGGKHDNTAIHCRYCGTALK